MSRHHVDTTYCVRVRGGTLDKPYEYWLSRMGDWVSRSNRFHFNLIESAYLAAKRCRLSAATRGILVAAMVIRVKHYRMVD